MPPSKFHEVELSVVVPAFREADSIEESALRLINVLKRSKKSFEVIVVIDGIVDDAQEILEHLNISNLHVYSYEKNMGKGYATRLGLSKANATTYLAYIDADLDLHPESLLLCIEALDHDPQISGAVGSKLHPESSVDYPRSRRIQSKFFQLFVQALFQLDLSDTQTGLKVFRAEPLRGVMNSLKSDGFAFDLEILVALKKQQSRFKEVPVKLDYQFSSSVTLSGAISSIKDALKIYFNRFKAV